MANNNIELPLKSLSYIFTLFKDLKINTINTCQRVRQRPKLEIL
jgi:hypothetical protein